MAVARESADGSSPLPSALAPTAYERGQIMGTSDGKMSFVAPLGWDEETAEYRVAVLEKTGHESTIEGYISVDGGGHQESYSIVSISAWDIERYTPELEDIGRELVDGWRSDLSSARDLPTGTFTTDAGDRGWFGGLEGLKGIEDTRILIVVVMGEETYAKFVLEVKQDYFGATDELLAAAHTVTLAPDVSPVDPVTWLLPASDGRTYSSEGGASIVIPEGWTYLPNPSDGPAFDGEVDFDYLGYWDLGAGMFSDELPVGFGMSLGRNPDPTLTALEVLEREFGEIGNTTTDRIGATFTVEDIQEWSTPGSDSAAWVRMSADYDASGEAIFEGIVAERTCYEVHKGDYGLFGCIDDPSGADPAVIDQIEAALMTLEFRP